MKWNFKFTKEKFPLLLFQHIPDKNRTSQFLTKQSVKIGISAIFIALSDEEATLWFLHSIQKHNYTVFGAKPSVGIGTRPAINPLYKTYLHSSKMHLSLFMYAQVILSEKVLSVSLSVVSSRIVCTKSHHTHSHTDTQTHTHTDKSLPIAPTAALHIKQSLRWSWQSNRWFLIGNDNWYPLRLLGVNKAAVYPWRGIECSLLWPSSLAW